MAALKEFKALYLAVKGIDAKGSKLSPDKKYEEEAAKDELREYLLQNLCKTYAQIELAKEAGWYDEEEAEKIVESAKHNEAEKSGKYKRKNGFVKEYKEAIISACESAKVSCDFKKANAFRRFSSR